MRHRIDLRHAPLVELDADVALDPRENVLLADRDQNVVAFEMHIRLAGRFHPPPALIVDVRRDRLEQNARQLAGLVGEFLGHEIVQDRDALMHRVLFLPR